MELIVGNRRITAAAIHPIPGGIEAELRGEAVLPLLDEAFQGTGRIEILGGGMDRRPMDVAGIEMRGASTLVTLLCAGEAARLH
ncbi:hypothetical protein O4J55_05160 [Paracoccus sp. PXZ]|uniref:hypothetical protein n=1 Tax=Paracoccus sp. MKU1 TaxID=1745182 RepID=UPI0007191E9F|nr:hypothetical protein [Paracoccus sp. MKU1]KRW94558.1 hypothetical protein AQY21_19325 [Paracoccus sp. MKU1]